MIARWLSVFCVLAGALTLGSVESAADQMCPNLTFPTDNAAADAAVPNCIITNTVPSNGVVITTNVSSILIQPRIGGAVGVVSGIQLTNNNGCNVFGNFITDINAGVTCDATANYTDNNGDTVTVSLSLDGTAKTASNILISGGGFGPAPAAGATSSEVLSALRRRLTALNQQNALNALGGVFDHLDNIFDDGGNGPVVTASGFSASTRGTANWLANQHKQKLETELADLPSYEDGTKVSIMPVAALMPQQKPKWNAWIKGNYRFYDGDGSSFDGHTIDVLAGLDYRVADNVVMGLVGGYGVTDFDTLTNGTSGAFEADGYTAGAYAGLKLGENAQLDTLAAYTYSDYENRAGTVSGDFTAHRVTFGARLTGIFESAGGFFFEPGARILYSEEYQESYTDSAGVSQPSLTIKAGRVSVGPKVGYVHRGNEGDTFRTWIATYGEYDFSNQGNTPTSGLPDIDDIISGRVSAGFTAAAANGVGISLEGDIGGIGSGEYMSYGGTARLNLPL